MGHGVAITHEPTLVADVFRAQSTVWLWLYCKCRSRICSTIASSVCMLLWRLDFFEACGRLFRVAAVGSETTLQGFICER